MVGRKSAFAVAASLAVASLTVLSVPAATADDDTNVGITAPSTDSATVNVFCGSAVGTTGYAAWPITTTVSPAVGPPGSMTTITVSVNASPNNGPAVALPPGTYRMEASINTYLTDYEAIGPTNAFSVGVNAPIFSASQLPTVASLTLVQPNFVGSFPITIHDIYYNYLGPGGGPALTDSFDLRCNPSPNPRTAPVDFTAPKAYLNTRDGDVPVPVGAIGGVGLAALAACGFAVALLRRRNRTSHQVR